MKYVVVGMFGKYGDAEATVLDLESAGIVGEQVEVITDIDDDIRTANTPGEPSTTIHGSHHGRFAGLFGDKPEVRDTSGEQPNYIGEQEYYANHLQQGGAVVIVRTSAEPSANRAAEILRNHDARSPGSKEGPVVRRGNA